MNEQRVTILEQTVVRMDNKLDGIAETLQSLARIEERQGATNDRLRQGTEIMQDHEKRIRSLEVQVPTDLTKRIAEIEVHMPGLIEVRGWVVLGILAGLMMIATAVGTLIFKR